MVGLDAIPTLRPVARGCADCLPWPEPLPSKPFFLTDFSTYAAHVRVLSGLHAARREEGGFRSTRGARRGIFFGSFIERFRGTRSVLPRSSQIGGRFEVESDLLDRGLLNE